MKATCWCGNTDLAPFSPEYFKCERCQTLVTRTMPSPAVADVPATERGLYGREYWFSHQEQDVGHPNIVTRARADLPERCMHWLRAVLKYKLPPGKTLELGAAHGGFVSILRQVGFDSTGLELSAWVVDYSRQTFGVPMLHGPVERQGIEAGSLDLLIMMDVMEHLPDPLGTIRRCLGLLKPDGVLMAQTPGLPVERSCEQMVAAEDYFLNHMRGLHEEHLFLFSPKSAEELLGRLGAKVQFEPAMFPQYDMFFVATRGEFATNSPETIADHLLQTPGGRMTQAMLDLAAQRDLYQTECTARLDVINGLVAEIERLRAESKPAEI
jgi:2-polyprenyl-3-methyl-5-hydroxy-6-metoxy-1,4-benzoquinol methylase